MLAQFAGFLALGAFVPYLLGVYNGKIQPKLSTWLVYFVMDVLILVGILSMDSPPALFVPIGFTVGSGAVLLLTITKNRDRSLSRVDKISLGIAALGAIFFVATGDGLFGLLAGLGAMFVGSAPTFIQVWREPEKEGLLAWCMFGTSAIANLFAPENQISLQAFIFPVVIGIINIPIMTRLLWDRFLRKAV